MIATLFDVAHQMMNTRRKSLIHVYIFKMMKLPISGLVPELNPVYYAFTLMYCIAYLRVLPNNSVGRHVASRKTQIHFDHFMISNLGSHSLSAQTVLGRH